MESPITASFRWTADELLSAQRVHMRHSSEGWKFRRTAFVGGPVAILFGVAILVARGIHPMGLFCIVMGSALLAAPLFARHMTLKHYGKRPDRDMVINWEFYLIA